MYKFSDEMSEFKEVIQKIIGKNTIPCYLTWNLRISRLTSKNDVLANIYRTSSRNFQIHLHHLLSFSESMTIIKWCKVAGNEERDYPKQFWNAQQLIPENNRHQMNINIIQLCQFYWRPSYIILCWWFPAMTTISTSKENHPNSVTWP